MGALTDLRRISIRVVVQAILVGALVIGVATPAFAARPSHGGGGGGSGGGTSSTPTGHDVSYPQCGTTFPSSPAFGIVGVNGGLANDLNPCLGPSSSYPNYTQSELYWAVASSTGVTVQPKASLYVNTADPGDVYNGTAITDWPITSLSTDPYGTCTTTSVSTSSGTATLGENSPACAWQYGYNKAAQDASWLTSAADAIDAQQSTVSVSATPGSYPWWLDVETANTWQTGTRGQEMNVADLQGMLAALQQAGVTTTTVGAYSTSSQWNQITGGTTSSTLYGLSNTLYGIPNWIPGAKTQSGAVSNCSQSSFTVGTVSVTQWSGHPDDNDYAC